MTPTEAGMEEARRKSARAVMTGVGVNAVLAVVKILGGIFGNTYALIADGIESTSDIATSMVAYGGIRIAGIPADKSHPYGHGKAEPLAAFLVALALVIAAVVIAYQSVREILTPHGVPAPFTLVILVAVVVVKETMFRFVKGVSDAAESTAGNADAWHHRSDAITSAAAFLGISLALVGGPGFAEADDWAALAASVVILFNAVRLARPAIAEIMDAAPDPAVVVKVREIAARVPGVFRPEKCFVRKMGFDYYVDLHIEVEGQMTVAAGHELAHLVKAEIRKEIPAIANVLVHVEPVKVKEELSPR